jgi:putative transposase
MEQVAADLKIRLIFSTAGQPRGRGKIERFFETLSQVFLSRFPGFAPDGIKASPAMTLPELSTELENFLIHEYLASPHSATGISPQDRWQAGGFLPHMPESLEQLDLLLLTIPKARRVQQDGIRFMGMRYIDPTLAAYVGEEVLLRYDPRDMAELRVFHNNRFLCRAICQELAGGTVSLREITEARKSRRRILRRTLQERERVVNSLIEAKQWSTVGAPDVAEREDEKPALPKIIIKRYRNE